MLYFSDVFPCFGLDCFARVFCFSQSFKLVWACLLIFVVSFFVLVLLSAFLYLSVHSFSLTHLSHVLRWYIVWKCGCGCGFLLFHGFFSHHILFFLKMKRENESPSWAAEDVFSGHVSEFFEWNTVFRFAGAFCLFFCFVLATFLLFFIVEITKQTESG